MSNLTQGQTENEDSLRYGQSITKPRRVANDNVSQKSGHSKNSVLRAVSINNEEHLGNLEGKEVNLKNNNMILINDFNQNLYSLQQNVMKNLSNNFNARVQEIWRMFLKDQLQKGHAVQDQESLNQDCEVIKQAQMENLMHKATFFILEKQNRAFQAIKDLIDKQNSQKHYLDDDIRELVEGDYSMHKGINADLK
jgi:hypothetical protein